MVQKRYDLVATPYGLCSDPAAEKSPPGSLLECNNVDIRRDGVITPRNGAAPYELTDLALDDVERIVFVENGNDSDTLLVGPVSTANNMVWTSDPDALVVDVNDDEIEPIEGHLRVVSARKNNYINTTNGIAAIETPGQTGMSYAGIYPAICIMVGDAALLNDTAKNNWLLDGKIVAYRFTLKKIYANGLIVESAPTDPYYITNGDGAERHVGLTFTANLDTVLYYTPPVATTYICVYRSKQVDDTIAPGDTLYLVKEAEFTDAQILDTCSDDDLGAQLYTNSTQQGLGKSNCVPPYAKEMAAFNGSLFWGNVTLPYSLSVRVDSCLSDLEGKTSGVGVRRLVGTFTNTSDTITAVSDTSGVEVGQLLLCSPNIPSNTYVESKTVNTIVMTKAAVQSDAAKDFSVVDMMFVKVDSTVYYLSGADSTLALAGGLIWYPSILASQGIATTPLFVRAVGNNNYNTIVIASYQYANIDFEVWATNGGDYDPPLNGPTLDAGVIVFADGTGTSPTSDEIPNGLVWSKAGQPEHALNPEVIYVGDSSPIRYLAGMQDILLILKDDGLYGLIGYNADSGWSLQQLTPNFKLLCSDAAIVVDDNLYALTDSGFVRVNKTGMIQYLSRLLFHDEIKDRLELIADDYPDCWAVFDKKYNEVMFSLPDSEAADQIIYKYNIITNSWQTATFGGALNHVARVYESGLGPALLLAGSYVASTSPSSVWTVDEDEHGRDLIDSEESSLYYFEDKMLVNGLHGNVGDSVYDDGNLLLGTITAKNTDTWTPALPIDLGAYADNTTYKVISDSNYVYFTPHTDTEFSIVRIFKTLWTVDTVYDLDGQSTISGRCYGLALDATYVYFLRYVSGNSYLYRIPIAGGTLTLLATLTSSLLTGLATDGSYLYAPKPSSGYIDRVANTGGTWGVWKSGLTSPYSVAYYDGDLYYTQYSSTNKVCKYPVAGGAGSDVIPGLSYPQELSISDTGVIVVTVGTYGVNKSILRYSGGSTYPVTNQYRVDGICVDTTGAETIFFTNVNEDNNLYFVVSSAGFITYTLSQSVDAFEHPTVSIYRPIISRITWLPKYGQTRALRKHFYDGTFVFSDLDGLEYVDWRLAASDSYVEWAIGDTTVRYLVPVSDARKIELSPSVKISNTLNCLWELLGLSLGYTVQAPRGLKK